MSELRTEAGQCLDLARRKSGKVKREVIQLAGEQLRLLSGGGEGERGQADAGGSSEGGEAR